MSGQSLPSDWESLRRMARQLETECESKLSLYARMTSSASSASASHSSGPPSTEATEREIEDLLRRMSDVVDRMGNVLSHASPSTAYHQVQRHRDTLHDHTREFRRTKANWIAAREHAELLDSVRSDINAHKTGTSTGVDYFLSERSKLDSTHIMVDDVIDQAQATRSDLHSQQETLLGAHRRMRGVMNMFPGLSGLMNRIRLRKRRDTIILACVTAFCIILFFLYHRS